MSRCKSCSANLPKHTNICEYCGSSNPIDLYGVADYSLAASDEVRYCPHCAVPMQTLNLDKEGKLFIEQCPDCFGFFFDPGELETILDDKIQIKRVNVSKLDNSNYKRVDFRDSVKYIRCPICNELMQRLNWGYKSGVIIDKCKKHGIWLDSGELRHLLEWKSAGGEALDERYKKEEKKVREYRDKRHKSEMAKSGQQYHYNGTSASAGAAGAASLLAKIFR